MPTAEVLGPIAGPDAVLPLYSHRVSAGFPSPAQDHLEGRVNFNDLLNAHAPQVYAARAIGDSMQGIGIFDGDLMVVDRSLEVRPGAIVIAAINGEVFVKRFCREQGNIVLRPENAAYRPRFILEGDELEVWGVVTHSLRDLQHG